MVGTLFILVSLVKGQTGQGSSNSGIFSGKPTMIPFLAISFSPVIIKKRFTTKTLINNLRESFFLKSTDSWDNNIIVSVRIDIDNF